MNISLEWCPHGRGACWDDAPGLTVTTQKQAWERCSLRTMMCNWFSNQLYILAPRTLFLQIFQYLQLSGLGSPGLSHFPTKKWNLRFWPCLAILAYLITQVDLIMHFQIFQMALNSCCTFWRPSICEISLICSFLCASFFFLFLSFYSFFFSLFFLPSPTLRLLVNLFVLLTLETLGTLGLWYEELVFWRNWCSEKKVVVSWVCCRHSLHWVQNMVFWITSYSCKHCY